MRYLKKKKKKKKPFTPHRLELIKALRFLSLRHMSHGMAKRIEERQLVTPPLSLPVSSNALTD